LRELTRIYFSFAQIRVIRGFKVGAGGGGAGFGLLRHGFHGLSQIGNDNPDLDLIREIRVKTFSCGSCISRLIISFLAAVLVY
jgi:hypothetical protein